MSNRPGLMLAIAPSVVIHAAGAQTYRFECISDNRPAGVLSLSGGLGLLVDIVRRRRGEPPPPPPRESTTRLGPPVAA